MIIKSQEQLEELLLSKCHKAVAAAEERVYSVIDSFLQNFYEWEPDEYIRTYQLLHSLVRTGIKKVGNGYEAEVYFDLSKLNYKKGLVKLQSGGYGWSNLSNEEILDVAMTDSFPHGRYTGADNNEPIWTSSMNELGNILELLETELKKQGIPIKKA